MDSTGLLRGVTTKLIHFSVLVPPHRGPHQLPGTTVAVAVACPSELALLVAVIV